MRSFIIYVVKLSEKDLINTTQKKCMESKLGKYKQRVIVTGGAGFIGSNLIKRLLQEGNQVVSLDNYSTGKKENEIEHDNITYYDVDLSDTDNFDLFMDKPDVIYHMACWQNSTII